MTRNENFDIFVEMKSSFLSILFFMNGIISYSQNLIPNGDFELGPDSSSYGWINWIDSTCTLLETVYGPDFWVATKGSPDRLLYGDIFCSYGNDSGQSGRSFIMLGSDGGGEAGKAILTTPIQAGKKYRLQYYLGWDTTLFIGPDSKPIGVAFKFNNGGDSITSPLLSSLNNSGGWNYYDTTFIASANSIEIEFMANVGSLPNSSMIKLDNIFLEIDSLSAVRNVVKNSENINIYPNPFNSFVIIDVSKSDRFSNRKKCITVTDIEGESILYSFSNEDIFLIERNNLNRGIYFLKIQNDETVFYKKLIIN